MSVDTVSDLGDGGRALWASFVAQDAALEEPLNPMRALALEACRTKDRLDQLDRVLRADVQTWAKLTHRTRDDVYELVIDRAMDKAAALANLLKQLVVALRLPDEATGRRPQRSVGSSPTRSRSAAASRDRIRAV